MQGERKGVCRGAAWSAVRRTSGTPQEGMFHRVQAFVEHVSGSGSEADLADALAQITAELGFSHYALTHHVDIRQAPQPAIRLDNYPSDWADYFDAEGLGDSDPVHRACDLTSVGFAWSRLSGMIHLTDRDRRILELAQARGLANGFTVPAHVPGEANGSCSFAVEKGTTLDEAIFPVAQLVGAFAFEAARRLWRMRASPVPPRPLTERQRDCLLWAARGKSDWEVSKILGISQETVIQHLKQARERYGVTKRTMLAVNALFDGTISFTDILKR